LNEGIGRAISNDGINWTKEPQNNPVLATGSFGCWDNDFLRLGSVVFDGSTYHLFYYGGWIYVDYRIGYAWSSDGINWTKYNDLTTTNPPFAKSDPVLTWGATGSWDDTLVFAPWVILDTLSLTYKMWYTGADAALNIGIGYATAPIDPNSINNKDFNNFPQRFSLLQNYPNPFNPVTTISFTLPNSDHVTLDVYNPLGQKIETLINKEMIKDNHQVKFDSKDLPSGIYFYRIDAGEFQQVRKMILLR